jgi:hypothetical protein
LSNSIRFDSVIREILATGSPIRIDSVGREILATGGNIRFAGLVREVLGSQGNVIRTGSLVRETLASAVASFGPIPIFPSLPEAFPVKVTPSMDTTMATTSCA